MFRSVNLVDMCLLKGVSVARVLSGGVGVWKEASKDTAELLAKELAKKGLYKEAELLAGNYYY